MSALKQREAQRLQEQARLDRAITRTATAGVVAALRHLANGRPGRAHIAIHRTGRELARLTGEPWAHSPNFPTHMHAPAGGTR